jgi:hypothetical protein
MSRIDDLIAAHAPDGVRKPTAFFDRDFVLA